MAMGCAVAAFCRLVISQPRNRLALRVIGSYYASQSGKVVVVTVVDFARGPAALCDEALGILANPTTFAIKDSGEFVAAMR